MLIHNKSLFPVNCDIQKGIYHEQNKAFQILSIICLFYNSYNIEYNKR